MIPESWFFRDARPFVTLAEHARARWVASSRLGRRWPL